MEGKHIIFYGASISFSLPLEMVFIIDENGAMNLLIDGHIKVIEHRSL